MAPAPGTLRVGRYFLALVAIMALLYAIVFLGGRHTPKLGIDLVGGTQVVFTAKTDNGSTPTRSSMEQARNILAARVNSTGVTQSTVVIQGDDQLVVSIPGNDAADIAKLGAAAVLNFRGVVAPAVPVGCTPPGAVGTGSGSSSATPSSSGSASVSTSPSAAGSTSPAASSPSPSNSGAAENVRPLGQRAPATARKSPSAATSSAATSSAATRSAATRSAATRSAATGSAASSAAATGAPTTASGSAAPSAPARPPATCRSDSLALAARAGSFTVPLKDTEFAQLSQANQQLLASGLSSFDCASAQTEKDVPSTYYVACADGAQYGLTGGKVAFLLGPVIVAGKEIDSADAIAPNAQSGQLAWTVSLALKGSGQTKWADYTTAHNVNGGTGGAVTRCGATGTPCADYVAFTLDGNVISSPYNISAINGGNTQITGQFTQQSASDLANQLKFGALPLSFKGENAQTVSATLGTEQLKAGLLAGGIGLILVVIYSLIYYRALGLVTIASLLVSGALTYGSLVMLGTQIGFTLSLAGIAGFIVAVGITADSFVVFFERLKDEVHEGRSVRVAVPRAWVRARRTILSADTVSFLAAAVLYYFTTDEVRGFAFTLGLSTILDLVTVFLFTHPLVSLLSRSRSFGSARFTGLDSLRGVPDPDERVRATAELRRPARPARTTRAAAGTAVLDPETRHDVAGDTTDDRGAVADEPLDGGLADPTDDPAPPGEAPRRSAAPEPGSAAERAAARRARLRARQNDEKGDS